MMNRFPFACLGMAVCAAIALSQTPASAQTTATTSGPSAWVYVSSYVGTTSETRVYGFTAASSGRLTPIAGSPFGSDITDMAVNGRYLFGSPLSGSEINSYRLQSNGALDFASSANASTPNKCGSTPGVLFLDHTGASLYDLYRFGDAGNCANTVYQAWGTHSTGALTYVSATTGSENFGGPLTITANNQYLYTSDCFHFTPSISGFKRNSNGSLTMLNLPQVSPAPASQFGCPYLAATDPANHVAIPWQPFPSELSSPSGPYQLATYTVQANGDLTTTSTWANMPKVSVGNIMALSMSPSGKLLAVAGSTGLQVFHFNGASPVTHYTGLLSTGTVGAIKWDNNNHLYALVNSKSSSGSDYRVAVFMVTPTSWSWVQTYTISTSSANDFPTFGLAVQPLPLP